MDATPGMLLQGCYSMDAIPGMLLKHHQWQQASQRLKSRNIYGVQISVTFHTGGPQLSVNTCTNHCCFGCYCITNLIGMVLHLGRGEETNPRLPDVEVYELGGLVRYETAEITPHKAMPSTWLIAICRNKINKLMPLSSRLLHTGYLHRRVCLLEFRLDRRCNFL